jgi:hypothetical protein
MLGLSRLLGSLARQGWRSGEGGIRLEFLELAAQESVLGVQVSLQSLYMCDVVGESLGRGRVCDEGVGERLRVRGGGIDGYGGGG